MIVDILIFWSWLVVVSSVLEMLTFHDIEKYIHGVFLYFTSKGVFGFFVSAAVYFVVMPCFIPLQLRDIYRKLF